MSENTQRSAQERVNFIAGLNDFANQHFLMQFENDKKRKRSEENEEGPSLKKAKQGSKKTPP